MKKHNSKDAYYQRLQQLAEVKKPTIKESSRNLGTLIDYKRAADGVAYGIVKENHQYFIKKSGLKEDPNVSDFAYIGGLENISKHQYKSLAEADKQRNMLFHVINEAVSLKPSKSGSRKQKLHEDKAGEEIEAAANKIGDLEAATDAAEVPAVEPEPDFSGEPMGGEEMPVDAPEGGEEPAPEMGGEEDVDLDINIDGEEEGGEEPIGDEDKKSLTVQEIEKSLGKITNKIRKTELTDSQVKSYVNSFLSAFKDKFDEVEIEDRKEMADKILKVVPDEDVEDLGQSVEDSEGIEGIEEGQCAECGSFSMYAESRGYTRESIMECGEEEMANLVSGYANAHGEGQNDGDFKAVALFITPEIIDKLKGDYGHEEYADNLTPYINELSEATEEDKAMQIDEFWGGLKKAAGKVTGDVKAGAQKAGQAVGGAAQKVGGAIKGAAQQAGQAVGQYATDVKQAYHTGEVGNEIKRLEKVAQNLGKQVGALNTRLEKAGQQPVNVRSILQAISNQVAAGSGANLGKFGVAAEGVSDPANIEVQPNALMEDGVGEETPEMDFAPAAQNLGVDVVKPDGAPTSEKEIEIKDSTVTITMSESEKKLRKYIRERLEVNAGLKKASLNEDKKSETLKKLDKVIDNQFKLYESTLKKKVNEEIEEGIGDTISGFMGKASQWMDGNLKKQRELKQALPTLTVDDEGLLNRWIMKLLPTDFKGGIERYVYRTPADVKLQELQKAANDPNGLGTIKIGQNNLITYIPANPQENTGPSDFARGRSRLGN